MGDCQRGWAVTVIGRLEADCSRKLPIRIERKQGHISGQSLGVDWSGGTHG